MTKTVLETPMDPLGRSLLDREEALSRRQDQYDARVKALYEEFGFPYATPEDRFLYGHYLAMKLAKKYIKGFSIASKPVGAPRKWAGERGLEFWLRVQIELSTNGGQLSSAQIVAASAMGEDTSTLQKQNGINARYHEIKGMPLITALIKLMGPPNIRDGKPLYPRETLEMLLISFCTNNLE